MKNIQLFVPKFRNNEIIEHISTCLDKGWTGLGFKTVEIEHEWKSYTGLPYAHFINSNTSGLHLAIKILKDTNKWSDGDEIITSPLTFVSSNHSIMYENMKPVFADVDEHLCLDPKSVESNITKKTKAVLFIGIGGNTGQLNDVIDLCKKHKLKLILDAAHMSGTFIKNPITGESEHVGHRVDVSVFSFQAVKNLPTADSGMICFNNEDYDTLVRKLSWLGIDKDTYQRSNDKGSYKWEYDLVDVGYKYHGNSIMASMALVGLKYLEDDNNRRREICEMYDSKLTENGIKTIKTHSDCVKSSRHLFQIVVNERNKFMELLNSYGVYPGVHYRDNTNYKMYKNGHGNCPTSHIISEKLISLPLHMNLTDEDIDYVIEQVIKVNNIILQ
jgi:dTDP-4-amino-4,6-dideoxygalactose transaminase